TVQEITMPAGNGVVCTDDLAVGVQTEKQRHRRPRVYKEPVLIRALCLAEAPQDYTSHCDHQRLLHMRASNHSAFLVNSNETKKAAALACAGVTASVNTVSLAPFRAEIFAVTGAVSMLFKG